MREFLIPAALPPELVPAVWIIAGLAIPAGAVVIGPVHPVLLFVGVPAAVVVGAFVVVRPLLVMVLMVVAEVTNVSGVLAEQGLGLPIFPASLAAGIASVGLALRDPEARSRLNRTTMILIGLGMVYLATQLIPAAGSVDVGISIATLRRSAVDCVFLLVLLLLAQITNRPWVLAGAIVVPMVVLAFLTVVNEVALGGAATFGGFSTATEASGELITTLRYGGPLPDSNFWGRHLVMGLPLACALLTRNIKQGTRLSVVTWGAAVLVLLGGAYLTQSRGTFLAAALAVVVWVIFGGRSARRYGLLLLPVFGLLFMLPGIGNRLTAMIEDLNSSGADYGIDLSIISRAAAQEIAWLMFGDRPMFGFGPGTYQSGISDYAGLVSTAVREPTDAPHNLYAQTAAELGIVGLVAGAAVAIGVLALLILRIATDPRSQDRSLIAAAIAAITAWIVASLFLHLAYFRTLAVVIALGGALAASRGPITHEALVYVRTRATTAVAAIGLGVLAFGLVFLPSGSPAVIATQRVTLTPTDQPPGWYPYALDIRSRVEMMPTFAILMTPLDSPVSVRADPIRGIITFTATASDERTARAQLADATAQAEPMLWARLGADPRYAIVDVGRVNIEQTTEYPKGTTFVAAVTGAGVALVVSLAHAALRRRRTDVAREVVAR